MDCVINGYSRGGKGYELFGVQVGGLKFINNRYITCSESRQRKKCKDMRIQLLENTVEKIQFEVNFPTIDTSISGDNNRGI